MSGLKVKSKDVQERNAELCHIIQTQEGTEAAREAADELIRRNIELVRTIAYNMRARYICTPAFSFDDAMQEGCIGLLQAAGKYKADMSAFSTYASFWIKFKISRSSAKMNNGGAEGLKIPESTLKEYRKCRQEHRDMTDTKFYEFLKYDDSIPAAEKERYLDAFFAQGAVSLNAMVDGEDGDIEYVERVVAKDSVERTVMQNAREEAVRDLVAELTEREQWVLRHRFGIDAEWTLEECGRRCPQEFGGPVSRERIRQIEKEAKTKLAKKINTEKYSFLADEEDPEWA